MVVRDRTRLIRPLCLLNANPLALSARGIMILQRVSVGFEAWRTK